MLARGEKGVSLRGFGFSEAFRNLASSPLCDHGRDVECRVMRHRLPSVSENLHKIAHFSTEIFGISRRNVYLCGCIKGRSCSLAFVR
jgi:hypothetical protein